MNDSLFTELTSLFFTTRQIIKAQLPAARNHDPNAWLRFETLRFIAEMKEPTMQDVAGYLRIKAPSATSLVAHLAKSGFISRKSQVGDKRIVRITLTARGKKELRDYMARSAGTMRKAFSKLNDGEINRLVSILRHLRDIHQK
ncbi:MAG TPA: MarR family transcriptional regulator [Candidatus Paceibacterota bacterium]|nr:MarR family transcriptional regulator [Candidatus Paceibacterota bacterium]